MRTSNHFARRTGPAVVVSAIVLLVTGCGSSGPDEVESLDAQTAETVSDGAVDTTSGAADGADDPPPTDDEQPEHASGDETGGTAVGETEVMYPDVVAATATTDGAGTWTFSATLSSPYDSAQRYADAWRVVGPDGEVYGIRELAHDHASEQPFTRSQPGIAIPDDVDTVIVEGRDQVSGWGGATVEVELIR